MGTAVQRGRGVKIHYAPPSSTTVSNTYSHIPLHYTSLYCDS